MIIRAMAGAMGVLATMTWIAWSTCRTRSSLVLVYVTTTTAILAFNKTNNEVLRKISTGWPAIVVAIALRPSDVAGSGVPWLMVIGVVVAHITVNAHDTMPRYWHVRLIIVMITIALGVTQIATYGVTHGCGNYVDGQLVDIHGQDVCTRCAEAARAQPARDCCGNAIARGAPIHTNGVNCT